MQQAIAALGAFQATWLHVRWQSWVETERGRFVPWLSVCMGAGVVAYFDLQAEPNAWVGAAAALSASLALVIGWRAPVGRAAALAGLFAALGFLSSQLATGRALPIEPLPTRAVILTGTVRGVDLGRTGAGLRCPTCGWSRMRRPWRGWCGSACTGSTWPRWARGTGCGCGR